MSGSALEILSRHPMRERLTFHPFFSELGTAELTPHGAAIFVGQWWHPLHYFPVFLGRTVAVVPQHIKTAVSKILFQELGEGDPSQAHERVYIESMKAAGFAEVAVSGAPANEETRQLVAAYSRASNEPLPALGFLYGTEVADLAMVSGIGLAVSRATGVTRLPWVDIHVRQEPEHVNRASQALSPSFDSHEEREIVANAVDMWQLWIKFFDRLRTELRTDSSKGR